ncbi:hypothetical protein FA95DRAFT_695465 [Auriscalpium vulgare]|uniref:Uncharacterized protein n=1 Tax=Auriscalpium vulgare TaxID=40419 RepID=A0ACB8RBK0_9AGAM|nr:hypothetical protein FA95DRAFT_695465 [Auriscalpium vulgare]
MCLLASARHRSGCLSRVSALLAALLVEATCHVFFPLRVGPPPLELATARAQTPSCPATMTATAAAKSLAQPSPLASRRVLDCLNDSFTWTFARRGPWGALGLISYLFSPFYLTRKAPLRAAATLPASCQNIQTGVGTRYKHL